MVAFAEHVFVDQDVEDPEGYLKVACQVIEFVVFYDVRRKFQLLENGVELCVNAVEVRELGDHLFEVIFDVAFECEDLEQLLQANYKLVQTY